MGISVDSPKVVAASRSNPTLPTTVTPVLTRLGRAIRGMDELAVEKIS